jgi:putative Mg2+ transporter-C (MgtC) family protein
MTNILASLAPHSEWSMLVSQGMWRLIVAAILGGAIGLERELRHKPAGLRTYMFISIGSAFFTILSGELAGEMGGDHTRVAAQIIPGIGFIGAGSILHSRGSVSGLTTAAGLFVIASIGMATGGGLYLAAVFATVLVLVALSLLGFVESRLSLKPLAQMYEVVGSNLEDMMHSINGILAEERQPMKTVQISRYNNMPRVQFTVDTSRKEHENLFRRLQQSPAFSRIQSLGTIEHE